MLTLEHLRIYRKYGADIDAWARLGSPEERAAMRDQDWQLIEALRQKVSLVAAGLGSAALAAGVERELEQHASDAAVIDELRRLG